MGLFHRKHSILGDPPMTSHYGNHDMNPYFSVPCNRIYQGKDLLVRNRSGMREWSLITMNNHPSNPQQPIHSLRLAPARREAIFTVRLHDQGALGIRGLQDWCCDRQTCRSCDVSVMAIETNSKCWKNWKNNECIDGILYSRAVILVLITGI